VRIDKLNRNESWLYWTKYIVWKNIW